VLVQDLDTPCAVVDLDAMENNLRRCQGHLAQLMAGRVPTGQTGVAPLAIRIGAQEVRIGWHDALSMPVWICPRCGARRYKLIKVGDSWGCRGGFGLRWRCRHRTGAAGLSRLLSLRRRLGSPVPFTPIRRPPLHAHKRIKLIAEARGIEAQLAQSTRVDVVEVLEKRYERHERRRSREGPRRQE
jgi:hypothetical protein